MERAGQRGAGGCFLLLLVKTSLKEDKGRELRGRDFEGLMGDILEQ